MSRPVRTALSAAVFALVLGACQRGDDTPAADATPAPEQPATSTADADAPAAASSNPYCSGEAGIAPTGELVAQRIRGADGDGANGRSEEHTSELQSREN